MKQKEIFFLFIATLILNYALGMELSHQQEEENKTFQQQQELARKKETKETSFKQILDTSILQDNLSLTQPEQLIALALYDSQNQIIENATFPLSFIKDFSVLNQSLQDIQEEEEEEIPIIPITIINSFQLKLLKLIAFYKQSENSVKKNIETLFQNVGPLPTLDYLYELLNVADALGHQLLLSTLIELTPFIIKKFMQDSNDLAALLSFAQNINLNLHPTISKAILASEEFSESIQLIQKMYKNNQIISLPQQNISGVSKFYSSQNIWQFLSTFNIQDDTKLFMLNLNNLQAAKTLVLPKQTNPITTSFSSSHIFILEKTGTKRSPKIIIKAFRIPDGKHQLQLDLSNLMRQYLKKQKLFKDFMEKLETSYNDIALSPDGKMLAICNNYFLVFINVSSGNISIRALFNNSFLTQQNKQSFFRTAFSNKLFALALGTTLWIYDLESNAWSAFPLSLEPYQLLFTSDNKRIVIAGSRNSEVISVDIQTKDITEIYKALFAPYAFIALSANGKFLAILETSNDRMVKIFSLPLNKLIHQIPIVRREKTQMHSSIDQKKPTSIRQPLTFTAKGEIQIEPEESLKQISLSPKGNKVAFTTQNKLYIIEINRFPTLESLKSWLLQPLLFWWHTTQVLFNDNQEIYLPAQYDWVFESLPMKLQELIFLNKFTLKGSRLPIPYEEKTEDEQEEYLMKNVRKLQQLEEKEEENIEALKKGIKRKYKEIKDKEKEKD